MITYSVDNFVYELKSIGFSNTGIHLNAVTETDGHITVEMDRVIATLLGDQIYKDPNIKTKVDISEVDNDDEKNNKTNYNKFI